MGTEANSQSNLSFTGERLMTEIYEYWSIEHLHRYALVFDLIAGKDVLDVASGEGYGTNLLASTASSVTGVDISEDAVAHAAAKYSRPGLKFVHGSASAIPAADHSFDVITSFETIEHHDQHEQMMAEVKRVLKKDGVFIISSPDKKYYSDVPGYSNPFHVKELYKEEFNLLIKKYFTYVKTFNQKTVFGSVICSADPGNGPVVEFSGSYSGIEKCNAIKNAVYNICIASDQPLDESDLMLNSVFCNEDVFKMYTGFKSSNEALQITNKQLLRQLNSPGQKIFRAVLKPFKLIRNIFAARKS